MGFLVRSLIVSRWVSDGDMDYGVHEYRVGEMRDIWAKIGGKKGGIHQ